MSMCVWDYVHQIGTYYLNPAHGFGEAMVAMAEYLEESKDEKDGKYRASCVELASKIRQLTASVGY